MSDKMLFKNLSPHYFSLGFYLMTPLLLGVAVGYFLDRRFGTKPGFVVAGIIFGTISSFYNLWKIIKEQSK